MLDEGMDEVNVSEWMYGEDCDEVRVLDEGMDEVNVRCEREDVWRDCDEVRASR